MGLYRSHVKGELLGRNGPSLDLGVNNLTDKLSKIQTLNLKVNKNIHDCIGEKLVLRKQLTMTNNRNEMENACYNF